MLHDEGELRSLSYTESASNVITKILKSQREAEELDQKYGK